MKKNNVLNDQFYTKRNVAKFCISNILNIRSYSSIIEPSAGTGTFSSNFSKNIFAYDIEPKGKYIKKQDFFKLNFQKKWGKKILFLGNPPFGKRSVLAKKFIKHAIELNAETIAFILPNTFKKNTNQKYTLFPKNWKLVKIVDIGDNAFYIMNNSVHVTYHVPCSFFIWTKNTNKDYIKTKDLRHLEKAFPPKEFSFLKRGDKTADFVFNGNSAKIRSVSDVTNSKAEHYIRVSKKKDVKFIKEKFKLLKFDNLSSVNGGNYWINQTEIIRAWNSLMGVK
ncbi:MAG: hypothetical protein ACOQNY_01440 [Mycoplasmoidaceae bacterium]